MTEWKSTMGAPLSDGEVRRITDAYVNLRGLCDEILKVTDPDPVEMLQQCTDLVMAVWEVRHAIDEAWYRANKRTVSRAQKSELRQAVKALDDLGVTEEELSNFLRNM